MEGPARIRSESGARLRPGDLAEWDAERALFPARVFAFLEDSQPKLYLLQAALEQQAPLLTLGEKLKPVAVACGVQLLNTETPP